MLLYIHIPFCDSKCSYCAFNSYVDKFSLKESYMDALHTQLSWEIQRFELEYNSLKSVFIGGGTPSTIAPILYKKIFSTLAPYLQKDAEITTEANPNSATLEWLQGMYDLGVNRVSFGVQSFDEKKLKVLNRAHNKAQAIEAVKNAHQVGFKNISVDLIYATLGDTKELLKNDLSIAFDLPINHLSAYALTIEEGTAFASKPQMSTEQLELTQWLFDAIKQHGFEQYEISNFGSYQSIHNKGYWEYDEYLGVGAGAVGRYKDTRLYPQTVIEEYISDPIQIEEELLSEEEIKIEKIFLGLRSIVGVNENILNGEEKKRAEFLVQEKKLQKKGDIYFNKDYLLSDEIALYLTS